MGHKEVEHGGVDHVQCPQCENIFPCHQLLALHLYQEHGLVLRTSNDRGVKVALTEDDNLDLSETNLSHSENKQQPKATKCEPRTAKPTGPLSTINTWSV